MIQLPAVKDLGTILAGIRTIAVVGLSPKENRPSHRVARYLVEVGYTVIPVNPGQDEILGLACYPDLPSIGRPVDLVDIFRRSDQVEPIVRDAIDIGARVIWMQQGIVNEQAADLAARAGLTVVMDRCLMVEHRQFVQAAGIGPTH